MRGLPLAVWLRERGHDVHVITGYPNYPVGKVYPGYKQRLSTREVVSGVTITRVPLYPSHDGSAGRRFANYTTFALSAATIGTLRSGPSDVIYAYHPPATIALPAAVFKATRRAPVVYHIADMWPESVTESGMVGNPRLTKLVDYALSVWCMGAYRMSDLITVLSPGFRDMLTERGVPTSKIEVVYNWTEEALFTPRPRDDWLARELGLLGKFNVLYAGNLGPFQALPAWIEAMDRLRAHRDLQFVIAGTGQSEAEVRAQAERLGVENVKFLGRLDPRMIGPLQDIADVAVVSLEDRPFFTSTIPSKLQAAMCGGCPVLIAGRGDAVDLIELADAGTVASPGDPGSIADAIERLYKTPKVERDQMGRRGRDFYLRELSLDAGGAQMERLFERVYEARRRR